MIQLETRNGLMVKSLETLYEEYIDQYLQGNFTHGYCDWNGDDALMSPDMFGSKFGEYCARLGYDESEYSGFKQELIEWCREHLAHLESKFA
jgi:hypothetical protein